MNQLTKKEKERLKQRRGLQKQQFKFFSYKSTKLTSQNTFTLYPLKFNSIKRVYIRNIRANISELPKQQFTFFSYKNIKLKSQNTFTLYPLKFNSIKCHRYLTYIWET